MFGNMGAMMEQARITGWQRCWAAAILCAAAADAWHAGWGGVCGVQVKKAQQLVQVEAVKVQKELAACAPPHLAHVRLAVPSSHAHAAVSCAAALSSRGTPATSWSRRSSPATRRVLLVALHARSPASELLTPLSQRRQEPRGCDITEAAMELGAEVRAARTRVCTRERCSERASDANKHCLFHAAARV